MTQPHHKRLFSFRLALMLLALMGFGLAGAARADGTLETIEIVTAAGAQKFSVEVMRTEAEHESGLMFRRFLPPDRGMLFDFHVEAPVMMWMKNTYLPLDMIFTDKSGTITSIAENAEPLSEATIPSGGPVYSVLEVNAGTVARLGIKTGNKMLSAIFGTAPAQ